ncbi:MAG TPA: hypothetical protein VGB91_06870 [Rhizomicrobium sp.]
MTVVATWTEIAPALHGIDLLPAIEEGFAALYRGEATVPPVGELLFPRGEAHVKYGAIRGDATFAVKVATGFYDNPKRGLPSSNGVMLLFDAATGAPRAVLLDEGRLTDIRTAVAGAVVAKYLAPRRVEAIGVIGTGIQARLQVEHLRAVTRCSRVFVHGRNAGAADAYRVDMAGKGFEVTSCATPSAVAARANLIVTATPSHAPLLTAGDIRPGTHITAVGADTPQKNELDPAIFSKADRVVADSLPQCAARGELRHALAAGAIAQTRVVELGAIIAGAAPGRRSEDEITVADLTGVAVQDIKIAQAVLAAIEAKRASA